MQKMKRKTDLAPESNKADNTKMPAAVFENLQMFHDAITSIEVAMDNVFEVPFEERQNELSSLDRARLDLMNVYAINSMFWMYLSTKGETPTEHPVKAEMDRIKSYMDLVKDVVDRQKAARLDAGAAKRMVKHSLWNPDDQKLAANYNGGADIVSGTGNGTNGDASCDDESSDSDDTGRSYFKRRRPGSMYEWEAARQQNFA